MGYVDRGKREERRRKLATDDGFWFCICFKRQGERERFVNLLGIPDSKYISGKDLENATQPFEPVKSRRNFPIQIPAMPTDNPIAYVEHTGNIELDALTEAMAIYAFFSEAKAPERIRIASQSDNYICACFESTEDAERYQSKMRMARYGTRYVDGGAWLKGLIKNGEDAKRAIQECSE